MYIRELMKDEMQTALELAWIVFDKFEAPDYSEDGVKEFYRSIQDHQFLNSLRVYGAFEHNDIVGTIATCNNGSHIALFFVSEKFQHQGIGKALFAQVCQDTSSHKVTVKIGRASCRERV